MRAMAVRRVGPVGEDSLALEERPLPEPGIGEVRIKVEACGVCRTDLHVVEGDLPSVRPGVVPGHQVVGRVDRIGPGTDRWKPGDRVGVAWLYRSCGVCRYCLRGDENLCAAPQFTGYQRPGGYADSVVADGQFIYRLPEGPPAEELAPFLCAGIIGYRALTRLGLSRGDHLGLYGFGASAHLVLQMARAKKLRVSVGSRGGCHREFARRMGAEWVGGAGDSPPEPFDGAILFAPAGDLVPPIMARLDRGGRLLIAGIHLSAIPSLDYEAHLFYERSVGSVTANTRQDGQGLLDWIAREPIVPHVAVYPLVDASRALMDLKDDRIEGAAVLRVGA